jgi:hypothetical protein
VSDEGEREVRVDRWLPASTIVVISTRKPQKMNACIRPGTARWNSFR